MSLALKTHLFSRYGSFADKRIKKIEKGHLFIGDTRSKGGIASDGSLYGWFCGIFVDVKSNEEVQITLYGNIPVSPAVNEAIRALNGDPESSRIELGIRIGNVSRLKKLSALVDSIVAPGRRYSTANYKYMCPRTAYSLRTLAGYLEEFWRPKAH